jgi:hypothetical protein
MTDEVRWPRTICCKRPNLGHKNNKRQIILDLIGDSAVGLTRHEIAAAIDSPTNCVSVMISQINIQLVEQGWKISYTNFERQPGQRGACRRRYRVVRL